MMNLKAFSTISLMFTFFASSSGNSAFTETFRPVSLNNHLSHLSRSGAAVGTGAGAGTAPQSQFQVGTLLNAKANDNYEGNGSKTFVLKKGSNEIKEVMGSRKSKKANQFRLGSFFKLNAVNGSGDDESLGSSASATSTAGAAKSKATPLKLVDEADVMEEATKKSSSGAGFKLSFLDDLLGKGKGEETEPTPPVAVPVVAEPTTPSSSSNSDDSIGGFFSSFKKKINPSAEEDEATAAATATATPVAPLSSSVQVPAPASPSKEPDATDKFTFAQRIESTKTGIVGLIAGGLAITPFAALHNIVFPDDTIANGLAQWEFDTDTGSIAGALFAIVYRYCVREGEEKNEMLPMGVVGAFVVVRTLGRIRVNRYCDFAPLDCGEPLGYFDYDMLQQAFFSGLESAALFGFTALAMEYCYKKGYISRFE